MSAAAYLELLQKNHRHLFDWSDESTAAASEYVLAQYAHAEGTLGIQGHMTWAAAALGVFQVAFVANLILSLRRGRDLRRGVRHPAAAVRAAFVHR